jgi:hypothetical protein
MPVALACAWRPRGEVGRWRALWPRLAEAYRAFAIVTPPDGDPAQAAALADAVGVEVVAAPRPFWTRRESLARAVATGASHVHYADGDRLLHWAAADPADWRAAVDRVGTSDFLVIGRSAAAMATHPRALADTEAIVNLVASRLLGLPVDLGGGSRGLSRPAAEVVLAHAVPEQYGDAAWPILAQRAGRRVEYLAANLAWETPDHGRDALADPARARAAAEAYDQRPDRWAARVRTAGEIVAEALEAAERPLA